MKRIAIVLFAFAITFFTYSAWAKNVVISLSSYEGMDVTQMLRSSLSRLNATDQATITLDKKGKYYVSGTIVAKCNIVMKGVGKKSQFVLCNGSDTNGFKAFTDDTFFAFLGTQKNPITVDINNLSINMQEHKRFWWIKKNNGVRTEKYAVKIYHAKKVDVTKVNSLLKNAECTNFNLRICSNITFRDCVLENYNNCLTGGILWIEGRTDNVEVSGNVFNKYGNDETLAFYGNQVDINEGLPVMGHVAKRNINISNNVFNYGYNGNDKADIINDVLIAIYSESGNNDNCSFEDISFSNNEMNISDPMRITLLFHTKDTDTHSNINIENNNFLNATENAKGKQFYKTDIKIDDHSSSANQHHVTINGNAFTNEQFALTPWGSTGLSHVQMAGGKVDFCNNEINDEQAAHEQAGGIIAYITSSSEINISANNASGLAMISSISNQNMIENAIINASNNTFEGITTVYCDKVKHLDLNFNNNKFRSANMNFFLQEFASEGSVSFTNNDVTVTGGNGQLMTHWSQRSLHDFHFRELIVTGNMFVGVPNHRTLITNMQNVTIKKVQNNTFFQ